MPKSTMEIVAEIGRQAERTKIAKSLTDQDLMDLRHGLIDAHAEVSKKMNLWERGFGSVDDMRDAMGKLIRVWDLVEFTDRARRDA